eukprot:2448873-Rhodomonas_salina.1
MEGGDLSAPTFQTECRASHMRAFSCQHTRVELTAYARSIDSIRAFHSMRAFHRQHTRIRRTVAGIA